LLVKETKMVQVESKNVRWIVMEPTFTPQLLPSMLKAPSFVWECIQNGGTKDLAAWLKDFPVANLEDPHESFSCTLLYSAARFGNLEAAKRLVERCAHVDSQLSKARSTPLHAASYFCHHDVVRFLLDCQADYRQSLPTSEFPQYTVSPSCCC
jgi:hypothetical protein